MIQVPADAVLGLLQFSPPIIILNIEHAYVLDHNSHILCAGAYSRGRMRQRSVRTDANFDTSADRYSDAGSDGHSNAAANVYAHPDSVGYSHTDTDSDAACADRDPFVGCERHWTGLWNQE